MESVDAALLTGGRAPDVHRFPTDSPTDPTPVMSGSFGEMGNLLKQAQKMQRAMDEAREEIKDTTVDGIAGAGEARVQVTGDGRVTSVSISDDAFRSGDREMVEELVLAALRDGIQRATQMRETRLSKVTGGLNLPGLL
ncbi:MAG: DNA-binding YbaB/EbfC family protein [Chlamydiales bacterium]|jgi:DNA-binding YbaB/EbfC family protein